MGAIVSGHTYQCSKRQKSGSLFLICNAHLDHINDTEGELVRINEMKLISERICTEQEKRNIPCIVLGDFYTLPTSESIKYCKDHFCPQIFEVTKDIERSFHDFGERKNCKIDYIYLQKSLEGKVSEIILWDEEMDGIYLSDHYPIFIQIEV